MEMKRERRTALSMFLWLLAIGWVAVLFFFSGQNGVQSSELSMRVLNYLLRLFPGLPYSMEWMHTVLRKMAHFGIFAVEGFLLGMALMTTMQRRALGGTIALLCCVAMAGLNEYHQSFMDGRSCALMDVGIDAGGALAGVLFAALILFWRRRRAQRRRNVII